MILIDLSQTIIAVAFQNFKGDYSKDLIRAMVFQTILSYKKKFGAKYGNVVLAVDSHGTPSWRKSKYPWYKVRRKNKLQDEKTRERWERIFECKNQIISEFKKNLTWKTVEVPGAEADDIIAVLGKTFGNYEPTLVVSTDGDFAQLQKYSQVAQWAAAQKKFLVVDDPKTALHLKILNGDKGDDIPNILSPNNSFTDGIRQKCITENVTNEWINNQKEMMAKYKNRYDENRELIDFDCIPDQVTNNILEAYDNAPVNGIQTLYKFFIASKMPRALEDIDLFKVKADSYAKTSTILCSDGDFFDRGTF